MFPFFADKALHQLAANVRRATLIEERRMEKEDCGDAAGAAQDAGAPHKEANVASEDRLDWHRPDVEMSATESRCPKCDLEFKSILHPFCQHKTCPTRDFVDAETVALGKNSRSRITAPIADRLKNAIGMRASNVALSDLIPLCQEALVRLDYLEERVKGYETAEYRRTTKEWQD